MQIVLHVQVKAKTCNNSRVQHVDGFMHAINTTANRIDPPFNISSATYYHQCIKRSLHAMLRDTNIKNPPLTLQCAQVRNLCSTKFDPQRISQRLSRTDGHLFTSLSEEGIGYGGLKQCVESGLLCDGTLKTCEFITKGQSWR